VKYLLIAALLSGCISGCGPDSEQGIACCQLYLLLECDCISEYESSLSPEFAVTALASGDDNTCQAAIALEQVMKNRGDVEGLCDSEQLAFYKSAVEACE
jgi:hypothetical protein